MYSGRGTPRQAPQLSVGARLSAVYFLVRYTQTSGIHRVGGGVVAGGSPP